MEYNILLETLSLHKQKNSSCLELHEKVLFIKKELWLYKAVEQLAYRLAVSERHLFAQAVLFSASWSRLNCMCLEMSRGHKLPSYLVTIKIFKVFC